MKILIQRVKKAHVAVDNLIISSIETGYLVFVGIVADDDEKDIKKIVDKIVNIRLFENPPGKMNESIIDRNGEILLVSQFTLCATHDGGRRPSFIKAMNPIDAKKVFERLTNDLKQEELIVKTGQFGQYMEISLINSGPVTIIYDSKDKK